MQKTNINWPNLTHTWNPATGCLRGCIYCYAKKIHDRFYKTPFDKIMYHEDRLTDPCGLKKPSTIFVGSMTDIAYWETDFLNKVINVCKINKRHTFMFLSKNYESYIGVDWPDNTMQGLTITNLFSVLDVPKIKEFSEVCNRPFLSIEPLMGPVNYDIPIKVQPVIVGAMTGCGKNNIIPREDWIISIKNHVLGNKIYWKKSMLNMFFKQ